MIKENYTEKELRSIYKDAKYNWSKNAEPLELARNDDMNHRVLIWKFDDQIHIVYDEDEHIKFTGITIISFKQCIKMYNALVKLLKEAQSIKTMIDDIGVTNNGK